MPAKYRQIAPVEAMQYTADTCRDMHAWWKHNHPDDDDQCGEQLFMTDTDGLDYVIHPGDWVVRHPGPNGLIEVIEDEDFREMFERVEENTEESA